MSYWSFWSLGRDSYGEPRSRVWIPVDYLNIKITYTYCPQLMSAPRYLCLVRYIHTCVCAISTYLCSMLTVNGMLFVCLCLYSTYLYYVDCTSTYANISNEFQQPYNVSFLNNELFFFNKKKKPETAFLISVLFVISAIMITIYVTWLVPLVLTC